jgi:plastocyanin
MRSIVRSSALACVGVVSLLLPAMAGAATKTVYAGLPNGLAKKILLTLPRAEGKAVKAGSPGIDGFRITKVTIHVGDTVAWQGLAAGFHTVDLPRSGGQDLPMFVANPAQLVTGVKDAAGNPFWFNGKPSLGFNPALFGPIGTHTYDGSSRIDSGLPLNQNAPPFKVTFTKPGTYKYFCDVHPGMYGYVVVKASGQTVPTAKQDAATLQSEARADVLSAVALTKRRVPKNTVDLGQSDGKGVEFYAMFPATLQVKAGTTVTFTMARGSREAHTASFGPSRLLNDLANALGGPGPAPQQALYPSDNPALGPIQLGPALHGNGFASTGPLDQDPTTPNPASSRITFTKPGTYHFICLIHPFMHGTIIVK